MKELLTAAKDAGPPVILSVAVLMLFWGLYKYLSHHPVTIFRKDGTPVVVDTRRAVEWSRIAAQIKRDQSAMPEHWYKRIEERIVMTEQRFLGSVSALTLEISDVKRGNMRLEADIQSLTRMVHSQVQQLQPLLLTLGGLETGAGFLRVSQEGLNREQQALRGVVEGAITRFDDRLQIMLKLIENRVTTITVKENT